MSAPSWDVPVELSAAEKSIATELKRTGKLFAFLRRHRHEIIDPEFESELRGMYREHDAGKAPLPPAMLAMVVVMQAYTGVSDAEAVERARFDGRWQLVLGTLGAAERAYSQGALCAFRERMILHDMDRRLLERTIEFARKTKGFDGKKLPTTLRLAVDSRPLAGAGRVEDAFNLLGRAGRQLLICAALLSGTTPDRLAKRLKVEVLTASSIKAGLDVDWTDAEQRADALRTLLSALDSLEGWVRQRFENEVAQSPLVEHLEAIDRLREQNVDPEPPDGGGPTLRDGVASDRIISLADRQMRHGRKSTSKTIDGYKAHLATSLDEGLVLAAAVLPANRPESEGLDAMRADLARVLDLTELTELHIDRGYTNAALTKELTTQGTELVSKPRPLGGIPGFFNKRDFKVDLRSKTVTCPAGQARSFVFDRKFSFSAPTCRSCPLRAKCTPATEGRPRSFVVPSDELQQRRLQRLQATRKGRGHLRERISIEHTLAHHARAQGTRARYLGQRSNVFDSRRGGALLNIEEASRAIAA